MLLITPAIREALLSHTFVPDQKGMAKTCTACGLVLTAIGARVSYEVVNISVCPGPQKVGDDASPEEVPSA